MKPSQRISTNSGPSWLRREIKRRRLTYARFSSRFERSIAIWSRILDVVTGIASATTLVALVVFVGYELKSDDVAKFMVIFHTAQIVFGINILYQLIFRFKNTARESRIVKWIVDFMILLSLFVWILPEIEQPWIPWLERLLFNTRFLMIAIGAYSLVDISFAISRIPGRRTNPSLLMAISFLFFIIIGSLVLMLPNCTYAGISYFDTLFVSASAVCITGLSPVDLPTTFTPLGILVISVLVQLGSLGIITFTSFFALFYTGGTSIYNQLLLKDIIYSKSMNSLVPTLLYVLGFTISIELIGALVVYFTIPDALNLDLTQRVIYSAFHSMSSFCNAGFSCLPGGMSNPALMHSDQSIYIVTSVLIFAGAVGFPILVNFKEIGKQYIRKLFDKIRKVKNDELPLHIYDLNTKIVLYTTLTILVLGSISFFALEYNNTLRGMSTYEKVVQSVFNSLIPRSAGFSSVNPSAFLDVTLILVLIQMIIGGSSQSMAGGIKVNTLGALVLNLRSVLYGHEGTTAFHRTINPSSIRRANAVILLAGVSLLVYCILILLLEPDIPAKSVIFEVVSAVFTVGSSLGATPELSDASKVILSTAMFFGRVGIISFLTGIIGTKADVSGHYPVDNIIIN